VKEAVRVTAEFRIGQSRTVSNIRTGAAGDNVVVRRNAVEKHPETDDQSTA
jgi:hypothetical protein